jgi:hypothetical protein
VGYHPVELSSALTAAHHSISCHAVRHRLVPGCVRAYSRPGSSAVSQSMRLEDACEVACAAYAQHLGQHMMQAHCARSDQDCICAIIIRAVFVFAHYFHSGHISCSLAHTPPPAAPLALPGQAVFTASRAATAQLNSIVPKRLALQCALGEFKDICQPAVILH